MFLAMTPPGSTDSSTVPCVGAAVLEEVPPGDPVLRGHHRRRRSAEPADVRRHAGDLVRLETDDDQILRPRARPSGRWRAPGTIRSVPSAWSVRPLLADRREVRPADHHADLVALRRQLRRHQAADRPGADDADLHLRAETQLLGQADALELAGGALRDLGQEHHLPWDLEVGQLRRAEVAQLALGRRRPLPEHHRRRHLLAELVVWHGEGERLGHRGVRREHVVHLQRGELLAAAVDQLLEPTGETEVALLVEDPLVAGPEPAVPEGLRVGLGIRLVAGGDVRPADGDLAHLPARQRLPFLVEDRHLRSRRQAHRAGLACPRGEGIGGHLVGGLGHSVALDAPARRTSSPSPPSPARAATRTRSG